MEGDELFTELLMNSRKLRRDASASSSPPATSCEKNRLHRIAFEHTKEALEHSVVKENFEAYVSYLQAVLKAAVNQFVHDVRKNKRE